MTTSLQHWKIELRENNICWIAFDHQDSKVNKLSLEALNELGSIVSQLGEMKPRAAVFYSKKPSGFIAGADIDMIAALQSEKDPQTKLNQSKALFKSISQLPFPTIALIHGHCLGGGLELALHCQYRVALDDKSTKLGLPEVMLGLHPGWRGTVLLPKLIGAVQAIPLLLSGRSVDARKAKKLGLVDLVIPKRQEHLIATYILKSPPKPKKLGIADKLFKLAPARHLFASIVRKKTAKLADPSHYPAPFAMIDNWSENSSGNNAIDQAETESFCRLVNTPTAQNLIRAFNLQTALKSTPSNPAFKPKHIHVIGAGVMGGDIATWCALQGFTVTLQDRTIAEIGPAIKRANSLFKRKLKRDHRAITACNDRLIPDPQGLGIAKADVIIEAIIENVAIKQDLFKKLSEQAKPDAILATNTSSLMLSDIAEQMNDKGRLIGLHFFNPVAKMQLVEIVAGITTPDKVLQDAAQFIKKIGRLPLNVKGCPGFLVNRILTPYMLEAVELYNEGYSAEAIDKAAKDFGMMIGPVELADTVGLDICAKVAETLTTAYGGKVPPLLNEFIEKGKLGKKSGYGFYEYKGGEPIKKSVKEPVPDAVADRLIYRFLNECVACLHDDIVSSGDQLDAAMIFGAGFAPFRGGPYNYMKDIGFNTAKTKLGQLMQKHGERFKPHNHWDSLES